MISENDRKMVGQWVKEHVNPVAMQSLLDRDHLLMQAEFKRGLIVPCYNEELAIVQRLVATTDRHTLPVISINASREKATAFGIARNRALWHDLTGRPLTDDEEQVQLGIISPADSDESRLCVVIDGTTDARRLPFHSVLGDSRNLCGNTIVSLYDRGIIESPWVHSTDADVRLGIDYFDAMERVPDDVQFCTAGYVGAPEDPTDRGSQICLMHIMMAILGARWGNPWGHTVSGASISIKAPAWCSGGGFISGYAAEDRKTIERYSQIVSCAQVWSTYVIQDARRSGGTDVFDGGTAGDKTPVEEWIGFCEAMRRMDEAKLVDIPMPSTEAYRAAFALRCIAEQYHEGMPLGTAIRKAMDSHLGELGWKHAEVLQHLAVIFMLDLEIDRPRMGRKAFLRDYWTRHKWADPCMNAAQAIHKGSGAEFEMRRTFYLPTKEQDYRNLSFSHLVHLMRTMHSPPIGYSLTGVYTLLQDAQ